MAQEVPYSHSLSESNTGYAAFVLGPGFVAYLKPDAAGKHWGSVSKS